MDTKLTKIYYSPQGYWKGVSAIKKLAEAAKVPENVVKQWLFKQAIWQIYLPALRYVPCPKFDVATPNLVHQPEPLTSKDSDEVAKGFQSIYRRSPLTSPQMLEVDPGCEFMGGITKEMEKHKTYIRRGRTEIHRVQPIVKHFNRTPSERLFGHQYAVEMLLPESKRSTEWVKRLPDVVSALNNEVTSLIGKKPAVAIKEKAVSSKPSTKYNRPVGLGEKNLSPLINVRYLYQPGELEGGTKKATDPIWSESLPSC